MMQEDEEWTKAQAWGCPHGIPLDIKRRLKRLSLGMPKASPLLHRQPSGRLR